MKLAKCFAAFALAGLIAVPAANATISVSYGWEDGTGTILSSFGNLVDPTNVSGVQPRIEGGLAVSDVPGPNSGNRYLHVAEDPHDSTPQAYVAFIEGLTDGDIINASFYGYDDTSGGPSMRIWGHYATSGDVDSYNGSAGGNSTYTVDTGWNQVAHSWTFDSSGGTRDALVIELRLYSDPSTSDPNHTDYFVDDLYVEVSNDAATITVAPEPASLALLGLGGLAVLRRRRR
ncbi:MAG TPA: PEP-CTERM sorting domain-containing protein [Phycisphaerae bacterium]|nr:PEP-CTERM sorting domain-containing protein [Phycisphaerales bacterium]HRX83560.1 PEP-CTERM sorting domain-containing protein [Phycisphaerae bacterium]